VAAIIVAAIVIVLVVVTLIALRPTVVPDLRGKPEAEVDGLLGDAGLRLGSTGRVATATVAAGRVVEQSIAPLVRVPRRSSVNVTLTVSPIAAHVPEVVGLTSASAVRKLTEALYAPVVVDIFGEAAMGTVLDQAPAAETSWVTGRPVAIGVAAGPDDGTGTTVPDLTGDSLEAAQAKLEKARLVGAGFLTQITTPATNVVVDQLPQGGTVVRPGTTVLLLLRVP
jgi:beta-lactam-binding protein with PASTA domain